MTLINSELFEFRLAVQRSEEKRLILLLGFSGVVLLVCLVRHFVGGFLMQDKGFVITLLILSTASSCFAAALWMVRRANREKRLLPAWIWIAGFFVEIWIPTVSLFGVVMFSMLHPLRALGAPALLMYGIFAVATVLRLSPRMSLLHGALAAAGYIGVTMYAVQKAGGVEWSHVPFLATYPVFLFLTGAMAAFVAGELKRHTVASMRAAELKRRTELLQSELRIAREIQQSLFPKQNLAIPGFEVIGWCKPATETGGDYYDWCQLPSKEGFVMLGDATGHGLGPALLIASCRAYVRADLPQNDDLSGFMSRLNERLSQDTGGSRFVTFVGTIIDESSGHVKLISAGHCPALFLHVSTGKVEQIKAHGIPLGMMPGQEYPQGQAIPLDRGDRLVVYTDGITEAKRANGTMYGTERLIQSVVRHAGLSGQSFVDALYRDLEEFLEGAALGDDLTLLSIRRS